MRKMRLMGLMGLMGMIGLMGLMGCKSIEYVPVEVVKTEIVHQKDTVKETVVTNNEKETVLREARPEDSLMLAKLGIKLQQNERLLILLQTELESTKNELMESHVKDSVRVDSVQVPYPVKEYVEVEKDLHWWQKMLMMVGGIVLFGMVTWVAARFLIKR